MPKISVFDFSEIPVYPVQIRQFEDESQTDINNELAAWVNRKNETGRLGEDIAKQYLQTKFKLVHKAIKDSYGYDIQADDQYFEVKTSKSNKQDFFITINELKTAYKHKGSYCIFYIELHKTKSEAFGYIIKNPFGSFEITLPELFQSIRRGSVNFDAVVYKVQLGNFLDGIERIDLSNVLRKIKRDKKRSKK
ncbi:MAG: DUF3883 domain-containing protein [Anaerolineales bacterium]|nr:DUF3883 domain-containing protein [Anaerolineales bacterium]